MTVRAVTAGIGCRSGQMAPPVPRTLKPGGCGTKTGVRAVSVRCYQELRQVNGLAAMQLPDWRRAGKSSRNMNAERRHDGFLRRPNPLWWGARDRGCPMIATKDAMYASEIESGRLRYDDGRFERCRAVDRKTQQPRHVEGRVATSRNARMYMRQEVRGCSWN